MLTLVSVVVGIVELDADVACGVIRFPRNPLSENRDCSVVLPSWQCAAVRCCALCIVIVIVECKKFCVSMGQRDEERVGDEVDKRSDRKLKRFKRPRPLKMNVVTRWSNSRALEATPMPGNFISG